LPNITFKIFFVIRSAGRFQIAVRDAYYACFHAVAALSGVNEKMNLI
jgi:hypothetical protein